MTSQNQIIIACVLASIAVPLGTFVTIKTINKLMRPPVNNLLRSHQDIELNYIEPIQPANSYQPIDLVNLNYNPYNWGDRVPSYYTGQQVPSYRSGTLPYYQSVEGININCCLENNINLEIILLVFIFLCFLILWKMRYNPWFNNFIKRFLLIHQLEIRILCIILAGYFLNKMLFNYSLYSMCLLIPFSTFEIDFRDSFEWKFDSYKVKPVISYIKLQNLTKDIDLLLHSLADDVNYSMGLSFIKSYKEWEKDKTINHPLFIDDAIIVNKESDPILITQFIMDNLDKKGYFITDWLSKDYSINTIDPIILLVTVAIKVNI
jgi:hypothetical protein